MARADINPEDRDRHPLQVEGIVTCPSCHVDLDEVFTAPPGIFEREDLIDPPIKRVTCTNCGLQFNAEWQGWTSHEDAG